MTEGIIQSKSDAARIALRLFVWCAVVVAVGATWTLKDVHQSVFDLANFVGPTVRSFLTDGSLDVSSTLRGGRMPLATIAVAAMYSLLGDVFFNLVVMKVAIGLLATWAITRLALAGSPTAGGQSGLRHGLLFVPLLCSPFIANLVNLQVEEAYGFLPIAFCFAVLMRPSAPHQQSSHPGRQPALWEASTFCVSACLIFLSKSSYVLLAWALVIIYVIRHQGVGARAVVLSGMLLCCLSWSSFQLIHSGKFALGTSLDGFNFYKGNNPMFLDRYPPAPGTNLDMYDVELASGRTFSNEWAENDFYKDLALQHILNHPVTTLHAAGLKVHASLISLEKYGSTASSGIRNLYETVGLLLFRLVFWAAMVVAITAIGSARLRTWRPQSWVFLILVCCTMLPYIAGFAYTRHTSVLIWPSCLFLHAVWSQPLARLR